jgi:hypothetical protein
MVSAHDNVVQLRSHNGGNADADSTRGRLLAMACGAAITAAVGVTGALLYNVDMDNSSPFFPPQAYKGQFECNFPPGVKVTFNGDIESIPEPLRRSVRSGLKTNQCVFSPRQG